VLDLLKLTAQTLLIIPSNKFGLEQLKILRTLTTSPSRDTHSIILS